MHTHYDAIIIGAGPAGSSTAILLARAGWRVALIEKHAFPRRKVCGECVAATNLPLLAKLGIGDAIEASAGKPLQRVALMCGDAAISASLPEFSESAYPSAYPWGKAIDRETLDTLLIEQAKHCGATTLQPWAAKDLGGQPGNYYCTVELSNKPGNQGVNNPPPFTADTSARLDKKTSLTLTAPILIAAHGSWELGPAKERKQPKHKASDLFAFKANYLQSSLPEGLLPVLSFPGGYGGMVSGKHSTTLAFCIRRDALARARQRWPHLKAAEAAAEYMKENCRGAQRALINAVREGEWLSVGPLRPGIHFKSSKTNPLSHAFLVGNAAGEAHPIIGEGISMAIQSAFVLSRLLLNQITQPAVSLPLISDEQHAQLHAQYKREWRRHFLSRIRFAAILAHVAMRPALMSLIMPIIKTLPTVLTTLALLGSKTRALALSASGH